MAGFFVKYRTADNEQPLGHEPQTNRHLTSVHKWDPIRTDDRSGMNRLLWPTELRRRNENIIVNCHLLVKLNSLEYRKKLLNSFHPFFAVGLLNY